MEEADKKEEAFPVSPGTEKIKVLLLEDDPYFFNLYGRRLRESGFEVLVEADEDEGLKRALSDKPDVVVLDISLPKEEDFGFIPNLKKSDSSHFPPVVILTDLGDEESKKTGLAMGAVDYLVRDGISFSQIVDSIKKAGAKKK